MSVRLLLIDNYDSFVFNALHLFQVCAPDVAVEVTVVRNDEDFLPLLAAGQFDGVIIGPGPGTPEDDVYFGHSKAVILHYGCQGLPVLGICLGFQGIYHLFGGTLKKALEPVHGKVSLLTIEQPGLLLQDVAQETAVMRYHSIMADLQKPIPDCFHLNAFVKDSTAGQGNGRELMALEHKDFPIYGVQFHPESFATECGAQIARHFVNICRKSSYSPNSLTNPA